MFGGFKKVFLKRFYFHIHKYSLTYVETANELYRINKTGPESENYSLRVMRGWVTFCNVEEGWVGDGYSQHTSLKGSESHLEEKGGGKGGGGGETK